MYSRLDRVRVPGRSQHHALRGVGSTACGHHDSWSRDAGEGPRDAVRRPLLGRALPHRQRRLTSPPCDKLVVVYPRHGGRRTLGTVPGPGVTEDVVPAGGSGRQWRRTNSPGGHTTVRGAEWKQASRVILGLRSTRPSRRREWMPKRRRPQTGRRYRYLWVKSDGHRCASRTAPTGDSPPRMECNRSGSGGAARSVHCECRLGGTPYLQQVPGTYCSGTPSCPGRRRHRLTHYVRPVGS